MPHATSIPDVAVKHGDWRDDLFQNGYAIIKNAVPKERAAGYVESMTEWLEKFPFGFNREDPSTWNDEHLPANMKGGMYHSYSVPHEKFVWDARLEPGVLSIFEALYGTEELLVSFDGINITYPNPSSQNTTPPPRWPHQDQNPKIRGFQCAQGIINLAPNGPEDGGLIVMSKSHLFNDEYFASHSTEPNPAWGKVPDDWHGFNDEQVKWFQDRGCEITKVCAEPGDLIVWDSRTVHWNELPRGGKLRAVIYTCYTPASWASEEELLVKKGIFERWERTTHWPHRNFWRQSKIARLGEKDTVVRDEPLQQPVLTEQLLKLAGAKPY